MSWQGAFLGGLLGLFLTHSIWGLIVGALIGQVLAQGATPGRAASPHVAEVFFRATFTLMGHIAKSDGRVSEAWRMQDNEAGRVGNRERRERIQVAWSAWLDRARARAGNDDVLLKASLWKDSARHYVPW